MQKMHFLTVATVLNIFCWEITGANVSVLSATFDTPESGLAEIRRWQPAKSRLACGVSCLNTDACTGYQIVKDMDGNVCILSKDNDDDGTTCSEDNTYLINYKTLNNNTLWMSPDYVEESQMDLREQCFPCSAMENSLSHDKFVGFVWIFSKKFGNSTCRVKTISEIRQIYQSGICDVKNKIPYDLYPQLPAGEVIFVIGINKHATLFTSTGEYIMYKYDGKKFKTVSVSIQPPAEYKMATSAVIIKGFFILYLNNGSFSCYTQNKYLKWATGAKMSWTNSQDDSTACSKAVDEIQKSIGGRVTGQIIAMTRIFRTYLIASNATVTCQFNLNTIKK